jgi:hypothetical protein
MKNLYTLAIAALLATASLQSCADDPAAPAENNKITFTQNAKATYTYTQLDSAESNLDHPMTDGADTVIQTTVNSNMSFAGKTGVAMKVNHYVKRNENDTAYYWQDASNNLYINNFGLDLINGPTAQAILQQRIDAGWILAGKMDAAANASWTSIDTTITFINLGFPATIKDVVTANGTTNLTIAGSTIPTKKFTHVITATLPLLGEAARAEIEIYVSADHGGIVRQVRKSAKYTIPNQPQSRAVGADMQMISYVK